MDNWHEENQEDEAGKNKILKSIKLREPGQEEKWLQDAEPGEEGQSWEDTTFERGHALHSDSPTPSRSISEKGFRQELEGRLVIGVDVEENRTHGHTHQEEQTSLASILPIS